MSSVTHFSSTFKDSANPVIQHLGDSVSFLSDARDFLKERSNIEKEYARSLETLVKKHNAKRKPSSPGFSIPPYRAAWNQLVAELESCAKLRVMWVDSSVFATQESLKNTASKLDSAKRHLSDVLQSQTAERDRVCSQMNKCKTKYHECCADAEMAKGKMDRLEDERAREKAKKNYHKLVVDMNIAKNEYLLAMQVANSSRHHFRRYMYPLILDHMQDILERHIQTSKGIWNRFVGQELETMESEKRLLEGGHATVKQIDPLSDIEWFASTLERGKSGKSQGKKERGDGSGNEETPLDHLAIDDIPIPFTSTELWKDNEDLVANDFTKVVLSNHRRKLLDEMKELAVSANTRRKEVDAMRKLFEAFGGEDMIEAPDAAQAKDAFLELCRQIGVIEGKILGIKAQVEYVDRYIAPETGPGQAQHSFKSHSFPIPTTCSQCSTTIWALSRQGLKCRNCGMACHVKCELRITSPCFSVSGSKDPSLSISTEMDAMNVVQHRNWDPDELSMTSPIHLDVSHNRMSSFSAPVTAVDRDSNDLASQIPIRLSLNLSSESLEEEASQETEGIMLFDYTPAEPESETEIEAFAGERVLVLDPDDAGWARILKIVDGEDRIGYVPSSYIKMMQPSDADIIVADSLQQSGEYRSARSSKYDAMAADGVAVRDSMGNSSRPATQDLTRMSIVRALFDYEAGGPGEIRMSANETLVVLQEPDEADESGWLQVQSSTGEAGHVPLSYVEALAEDEEPS